MNIDAIIREMRERGRTEMVHYAGAAHRDLFDYRVVEAYVANPARTEDECLAVAHEAGGRP